MRFDLDEQQRDFAASIDAALAAADLPGAVRAWAAGDTSPGRKVWAQLADLGVTALVVPEKFDGIEAHPVDLAKQRTQFGRAIGTYQAIKHKLADVHIAIELARPLVYGAALSLADNSEDTARDVSAAKVAASDAALLAARSALQTHGAIGFTQEHDMSLLLLRVQALRSAWGDPTVHRRRVLAAL